MRLSKYRVEDRDGNCHVRVGSLRIAKQETKRMAEAWGKMKTDFYVVRASDRVVVAHLRRDQEGSGEQWYWAEMGL